VLPPCYPEPLRLFWWLLGALTLLRLIYAFWLPLDLSGDETYYWDWGRQPDWGYFSKPPLIGWLMALLGLAGFDSTFGIRACATLLVALGLGLFFWLGRDLADTQTAIWATLLFALSPAVSVLGLVLTIDVPLLLCWTGALLAFHRWIKGEGRSRAWGFAVVLFVGMGSLAKQTMLVFLPLALIHLVLDRESRHRLTRPSLWMGGLAALGFLVPTLWWNWDHGWVTLVHTGHHFTPSLASPLRALSHLGELLGSHAAILGVVTWGLVVAVVLRSVVGFPLLDQTQRFLFIFGGLPLLMTLVLALFQRVEPNWPAPFFIAALLQAVIWLRGYSLNPGRWLWAALIIALLGSALTYASPLLPLQQRLNGLDVDFLRRLRGWEEAATGIQELRESQMAGRKHWLLVCGHRYHASELAFYLPDRPRIHRWPSELGAIESQYELWGLPSSDARGDALIIGADCGRTEALPNMLLEAFEGVEPLGNLEQDLGSGRTRRYRLFLGLGWRGIKPVISGQGE
jgi:4-amino-4-deoxy-L-arabinose transferase-like glycosyltransferase